MSRPSKDLTRRVTLRTSELDHAIIRKVQKYHAGNGVTLSENDTIRFLIQCATLPPPITEPAARRAIEMHWQTCEQCTADGPPRCAAGVYLRDCYTRVVHLRRPPSGIVEA